MKKFKEKLLKKVYKRNKKKGIFKKKRKLNNLIKHSNEVEKISKQICNKLNITGKELKLIRTGALLHDVEKHTDTCHNLRGAEYVEKMSLKGFNEKDKELIKLMVECHKGKEYKKKNYDKETIKMIEIVRAADKISKIYKKSIKKVGYKIVSDLFKLKNKKVRKTAIVILLKRVKELDKKGKL